MAAAAEKGYAVGGLAGMRESMLPVQKEMVDRGLGSAYELATTCALLGKKEEALHNLQAAYEKREVGLLYLSRDSNFTSLRNDFAYKEIIEQVAERLSKQQ